jgi:undecaprenyl-diphosphatase
MELLQAIILGIVEGFTEFLPISSTGHLIVTEDLLGYKDAQDLFTVVVQLGAILAIVWFYRHDLLQRLVWLLRWRAEAIRFWLVLIVATLPAGLIGLALNDSMEHLTTPLVVAVTLILGGIILWIVDRKPAGTTQAVDDIGKIAYKKALLVGLGQSVAILPGVSRSGASIVTGLATGLNRPTAAAFSFYLSIPIIILASGFRLFTDADQLAELPGGSPALIAGVITAFITALLSVRWLLGYVSRHNFRPFAYYRIAAGVLILMFLAADIL